MNKIFSKVVTVLVVAMAPVSISYAGLVSVPEPSMLPLFAVAAAAFYIIKKRKK